MDDRTTTTTGYAMLGLLAVRPWSVYELTKQMGRSLRHVWPRAESNIYAEAKRLVDGGLASSSTEQNGRRPRTLYAITDEGRVALHGWLATASAGHRQESEAMLKVLFGNEGSRDELLANLRQISDEAARDLAFWAEVGRDYLHAPGPFPERLHVNALFFRWVWDMAAARGTWAAWAMAEVERWPDAGGGGDPEPALRVFRDILRDHRTASPDPST